MDVSGEWLSGKVPGNIHGRNKKEEWVEDVQLVDNCKS